MLALGMVIVVAGYAVGSYGWVLLQGWDIPLRSWFSPLHPYRWPAGGADPPPVPPDRVFPGGKNTTASGRPAGEKPPTVI